MKTFVPFITFIIMTGVTASVGLPVYAAGLG